MLLGPNGSGKTTLFRVLSTLIPLQQGEVQILGNDLRRQADAIRAELGVVFQAPSVDKKLTVAENITHYGRLYGLGGSALKTRTAEMLGRLAAGRSTKRQGRNAFGRLAAACGTCAVDVASAEAAVVG